MASAQHPLLAAELHVVTGLVDEHAKRRRLGARQLGCCPSANFD
jgi:hypothetical protein